MSTTAICLPVNAYRRMVNSFVFNIFVKSNDLMERRSLVSNDRIYRRIYDEDTKPMVVFINVCGNGFSMVLTFQSNHAARIRRRMKSVSCEIRKDGTPWLTV